MLNDRELNAIRERLADYAHDAWTGWMVYLFRFGVQTDDGRFVMDADKVARWRRQMNTPYADLTEAEKESDRKEADRMMDIATIAQQGRIIDALRAAVSELVTLKDDRPADYEVRKPIAWAAARDALAAVAKIEGEARP